MGLSRFAAACLCLATLALGGAEPIGVAVEEDRACAWVGDTEVCVPPR